MLHTSAADPISAAADIAHAIAAELPSAHVTGLDPQLVALGDIADRLDIRSRPPLGRRQTPRRYPVPGADRPGKHRPHRHEIWAWPDVLTWLREEYRLDPELDTTYLTTHEAHELAVKLDTANLAAAS